MKKKHIIWLLLIVGIGIAAFYGYRVQQEAAQAPSSAHQQATVTDETEAADTSADDEAAGVDAVSEDIAAEEAAAKKTESSPTDEAVGPRVDVVPAQAQELGVEVQAVGSLWARDAVMLRAEITGKVAEIDFKEGSAVEQGQLLLKIDDSLLRAEHDQAQANLQLKQSQYARARQLSQEGFISAQARDEVASELAVSQAQANLAQAQLEKTTIRAPFDGVLGFRLVSVGDYVAPGTDLVRIEAIDPLFVEFQIPEHYLPMVREGTPVTLRFDALSGEFFPGQIDVIAPALDTQGRAVQLRARIPNPDARLRPGMFARVQVHLEQHEAIMIPESAIAPSAGEQYIFVLQPDQTVRRRSVKIGIRRGGWVEVSGIEPGQEVLITGLQKVRDGVKVQAESRTVAFE
ncbi:MAG TPA: efflux RND transporter periplasmic adaptor subunit [Paenalcaligenes sp.]|nr:efflux RND transporter periplasmic adaptor subunit [Paenalcaligenes sp.]